MLAFAVGIGMPRVNAAPPPRVAQSPMQAEEFLRENAVDAIQILHASHEDLACLRSTYQGVVFLGCPIDFSLVDMAGLIRRMDPRPQRALIPVVKGCAMEMKRSSIMTQAQKAGIEIEVISMEPAASSLRHVADRLSDFDVLIMTPSYELFGPEQMPYWVRLTARHGIPMVGAWADFQIKAGASVGFIRDAGNIQVELERQVRDYLAGRTVNPNCLTTATIKVNKSVLEHIEVMFQLPEVLNGK